MFLQAEAAINYTTLVREKLPRDTCVTRAVCDAVLCVAHLQSARSKRGSRVEFGNIFAH